jgi:hypothetical protein
VDEPARSLDAVCDFLGVERGLVPRSLVQHVRWADEGAVNSVLRRTIRTGAALGSLVPPQAWRRVSRPLVTALRRAGSHRPRLAVEQRRRLADHFRDDIALLERLLDREFQDWLSDTGRGTYAVRRS